MAGFAPLSTTPTDSAASDPANSPSEAHPSVEPPSIPPSDEGQASDSTPDLSLPRHSRLRLYADLAKLRLNTLVVATTLLGFLLVSHPGIDAPLLLWTLLGTGLLAGGSATFNQILERHRDAQMRRTRNRPLVTGAVSVREAVSFGVLTSLTGAVLLWWVVNPLTALLGILTWFVYVALYTPLKTRSTINTLLGGICGALPPMMGVTAATGALTIEAWILGAILFVWQIPHFLSLAWLCRQDYEAAGYKMLPHYDPQGLATARHALIYTLALIPLTLAAPFVKVAGLVYLVGALLLGGWLAWLAWRFLAERERAQAKGLFLGSVIYLPLLLILMVLDRAPPPAPPGPEATPAEYFEQRSEPGQTPAGEGEEDKTTDSPSDTERSTQPTQPPPTRHVTGD